MNHDNGTVTPLDVLHSDWNSMVDQVERANEAQRKSDELSIQLATERDVLVENLDRATTELNFWRSYALEIETRLDVITSVISDARSEARQLAKAKMMEATPKPQSRIQEPSKDVPDAVAMFAPKGLPKNNLL